MHSTRTRHEVRRRGRAPCVRRDTPLHHITRACVRPRQGQGRHVAGRGPGRKRPPAPSAPPTVPTPVLPSRRHPLVWSRFVIGFSRPPTPLYKEPFIFTSSSSSDTSKP
ncbi:hypothetical protein EVAR_74832_1 [Eumeta japonica]|uniref:Uncharacterized protein n=1 Tax=Eumeta variegata TaxID=151549 RepID=A0A4C1SQ49_EUMVA|nr:hypothetical protein EVAR_74832_1 [Eumeta japonica]